MKQKITAMSIYRTWSRIIFPIMLLFTIMGCARDATALQTKTLPEPAPRTMEEGGEEIFPCCRLDASSYPGVGTFGFANRMSRSFAAWWGNDVAWWGKRYPEAIGSLILSDLASSVSLFRATQPPEDVTVPQVEDPESSNLWEPIWRSVSPCCQESVTLPIVTNLSPVEPAPRVNTARINRPTPLRRERSAPRVTTPWRMTSVPEPLYLLLLGSGLLGLGMLRNRLKGA